MIQAASHALLATSDVPSMRRFFEEALGLTPHFANDEFCEFVLPSRFRIALFRPVGKSAKTFRARGERGTVALGVTVEDVDAAYARLAALREWRIELSGPPREHPWGEKSFLLIDPDGNRWEIAQSPSPDGMLVNR